MGIFSFRIPDENSCSKRDALSSIPADPQNLQIFV